MKSILAILVMCVMLILGVVWYANKQQQEKNDAAVQEMKEQTEQFLRDRAHKYYSKLRAECAKYKGGLPCEQRALLDCRALYGSRCEGDL